VSNRTDPPHTAATWLREHASDAAVGIALAVVVASTGFVSYTHICALTLAVGQSWKTAHLMPFAIDGQIVIGSFVVTRLAGRPRWWGLAGILPGLAESLYANWESGIAHGRTAAIWAAVAAESFAVSSALFELWMKNRKTALGRQGEARPATTEQALGILLSTGSRRAVAAVLGVEAGQVQRWERMLAASVAEEAADAA
jgi:hypothetical protein